MRYPLLVILLFGLALISFGQDLEDKEDEWSAKLLDWTPEFNQGFCEYVSKEKKFEGSYFFSSAFIYLAEKSGAVQSPKKGEEYNMDVLDKNVIRSFIELNFTNIKCGSDKVNFLAAAYEANNTDLLNDLLEISIIFFDGRQYTFWNYDLSKIKTNYGNGVDESFISFLLNSEDMEKHNKWLDMIDRRVVRSMKYIYQTNSKQIAIFLMKNKAEMINRLMQYGPGEKQTFLGYVEGLPESERRSEWLEILRADPATLQMDSE